MGCRIESEYAKTLNWWEKCLIGLLEVRSYPLEWIADFILKTKEMIKEEGEPFRESVGLSLPALRIPRDKTYFAVLTEKTANHKSRWKSLFTKAIRQRACYLLKQTPTQTSLTNDQLCDSFDKVNESITVEYHDKVMDFIFADNDWNPAAEALCNCEWEGVSPLFDGLKREKFNLGVKTQEFFDERYPELLTNEETEYLELLKKRNYTNSLEEDEVFYESHRQKLKEEPSLKGKWDKFIFGAPVECEDLLSGIVSCLETFFDQNMQPAINREIIIRSKKNKT